MLSLPRLPSLVLLAGGIWTALAAGADPLATRQTAFNIPFRIDAPKNPADRAVEVQLYVSTDRGGAWKLHSHVPPEQGKFTFRAEKDGEYWFLVRTKDTAGRIMPNKPNLPELQVLVDTTQPGLEINAFRGEAGDVTIRWRASDPDLQPQNLRLDYQAKGAVDLWQSVALDLRRTRVSANECQGEATLWTRTTEPLIIRGEITDRAGNLAVTQIQVEAKRPPPADTAGNVPNEYPTTSAPAGPNPNNKPAADTPASSGAAGTMFTAMGMNWPVNQQSRAPLSHSKQEPATVPPVAVQRLPVSEPPVADNWVQPPLRDIEQRPARRPPSQPVAASAANLAAPPVRPRMVNSRTFQIEYDITGVPGGVRKVELWGTRDGGQRWTGYGPDNDLQSPMVVTVEGEGMYGFRIVLQSNSGAMEFPPKSGDRPESWVGVDVTRPTCHLTQAQQAPMQPGQLLIGWDAHDQWLAERPISLSYSQQPNGPWLPIATGLENTGRYTWQLDERVPQRFYLRLEARDQAGNLEVFQSESPVVLSRTPTPGRIRDVRPTYESTHRTETYRFF